MAPEDTGSGTGSVQEPAPSNKSSDETSLAARRARLRGSLTKQVTPPDPYQVDPYTDSSAQASEQQTAQPSGQPAYGYPEQEEFSSSQDTDNGSRSYEQNSSTASQGAAVAQSSISAGNPANQTLDQAQIHGYSYGTPTVPASPAMVPDSTSSLGQNQSSGAPGQSAGVTYDGWPQRHDQVPDSPAATTLGGLDDLAAAIQGTNSYANSQLSEGSAAPDSAAAQQTFTPTIEAALAAVVLPGESQDLAGDEGTAPVESSSIEETTASPKATDEVADPIPVESPEPPTPSRGRKAAKESAAKEASAQAAKIEAAERAEEFGNKSGNASSLTPLPVLDPKLQRQTVEVLHNIDSAMGACAMNLSALQKIGIEQTEAMRSLAETMQSQNFFEIGLNLNSMIESMSAALEPMKAVGELVPAIDQLVVALETREPSMRQEEGARLQPEQLLLNLADQLTNGIIDPWTFKSAYIAIYPNEQTAELLHRLVDLLGTQRVTGEVFRATYDAVQAAEGPSGSGASSTANTIVKVVQDETLLLQIEELRRLNDELNKKSAEGRPHDDVRIEELQTIVEQLQSKLELRETEFGDLLSGKDRELQDAQELLTSRWEEFNARYDEMTEMLQKRDELLAEKEAELARKESENIQLKTQMEELRDQTKEMVTDLHKQMAAAAKPKEEPPKQGSFFDTTPQGGGSQNLFDPNQQQRPLFQPQQQQDQSQSGQMQQQPQMQAPQPPQQQQTQQQQQQPQQQQAAPAPQSNMAPQMSQANSQNQAIPRPSATTPFLTGGSYGSGVRAQVFEVIVRQALAGAPWREICAGPMQVNNISPEEVETEVRRRQALLKK